MNKLTVLLLISLLWSCNPLNGFINVDRLPLPVAVWSEGCAELAPYQEGYRLSGMCCEYVLLPVPATDKDGTFRVKGSYHAFTGAGFSNQPIDITGSLANDDSTLTLSYTVNGTSRTFTLKPGKAKLACDCYCD